MTQPSNPKGGLPPPDGPSSPAGRQDTVLLSDVSDAPSLIDEISAPAVANTNLSSLSLAALGQRYDILAEAGCGSMGNVYKARDRETGETVALKLLKPEIASDQAMMERFKNELLFARKITHKNVCRVHEFNRIGGIAYTSMEFVEGESLRSVLNRFGGLPLRKAFDMAQQICSGLKEAHAQGIVHRDLKPENVMIDAQGNVKIMDFGIARSMEAGTRLTGSMVGTPAYMAPEQVAGKPVDYRTDIYSLGLMLYEMFTGRQAFHADNPVAVALKQIRETPPPPHDFEPAIPVGIERAILKCLEKEPEKRFQSASELEKVLRAPAAAVMAGAPSSVPRIHSSHTTTPLPPPAFAQPEEPRLTSALLWVLLGALLVLAVLGGLHASAVVKSAEGIAPPPHLSMPRPPEFAYEKPVAPAPEESTPETKTKAPATAKPATASKPPSHAALPPPSKPAPKFPAPRQSVKAAPPPDVQQRAEQAFGEEIPKASARGMTYLWVGRYPREDRAQAAAKKIEDLGLPVEIIPKRTPSGEAFVVFTGPFTAERIPSIKKWLEGQGFLMLHPVRNTAAGSNP